ncbi:alpha/beta fold hydrolase [bacterium]|nr:MAG: alpha/beta fold hydrolase [bacterium]
MPHTLINLREDLIPKESFSAPNGHLNTVIPSLFYSENIPYSSEQIEIPTIDNDFLELDWYENPSRSEKTIIILHGLEGSSKRYYVKHLAHVLLNNGYNIVALNARSCGTKMNKQLRFYHSGETEDLKTTIEFVHNKHPNHELYLAGFSMGANSIQVYLGSEIPHSSVKKAVCISAPYDLYRSSLELMRGFNQVYQFKFLRTLKKKLDSKRLYFPSLPEFNGNTLYDFDEVVTSKIHGFLDAEDYYKKCSGAQFINNITLPVLFIHSQNDPFCSPKNIPIEVIKAKKHLGLIITQNGGHVGFVTYPTRWLQQTVSNWLQE